MHVFSYREPKSMIIKVSMILWSGFTTLCDFSFSHCPRIMILDWCGQRVLTRQENNKKEAPPIFDHYENLFPHTTNRFELWGLSTCDIMHCRPSLLTC